MIVSFLIPTRGRLQSLLESIKSIKDRASPNVQIEILIRIDEDDLYSLAGRDNIPKDAKIIIGPRWCGYECVHIFYNELASQSHGDWIILWNDDTFMVTDKWDKLLPPANRVQVIWLYSPISWTWAFPAITRKLYEIWGYFAPPLPKEYIPTHDIKNADARIFEIWKAAGRPIPDPNDHSNQIIVDHRRNEDNIRKLDIKPQDKIFPSQNSVDKDFIKILRESKIDMET